MSESRKIPKGWASTIVNDIAEIIMGQSPRSTTYNSDGIGLPFFQGKAEFTDLHPIAEKWCSAPNKIATNNDVLLSVRAPVGATNISDRECCIGRGLAAVRYHHAHKFIYYYLRLIEKKLDERGTGTTFRAISGDVIRNTEILLPPLPEQHRIVAKIEELFSSLDKGIENLKTAQQQLKVYRQAVLKWAFEGKLTNKNVKEGELPNGWARVSLKELVDKISDGPFGSNLKTSDYVDNGVRVIRLENIGYMEFRNEFKSFVTKDKYETIKKHVVSKGDIIFSSFVSENIRAAILPDFIDRAINKADCFLVRPSKNKSSDKYLLFYFSTREMFQQLIGEIHGATRPRINTTQLKSCQIPLAPLPEQQAIVAEIESRLSVCDKIEESIEQSLRQAESLRQSILNKAFEGKLVPQNPNDEPASKLLERIRVGKEALKKSIQIPTSKRREV